MREAFDVSLFHIDSSFEDLELHVTDRNEETELLVEVDEL